MSIKTFLFLSVIAFCSCQNRQAGLATMEFRDTIYPKYRVLNEELFLNSVFEMRLHKDQIALSSLVGENWLHYFDKNTGNNIKSFGTLGRGKGEFMALDIFSITDGHFFSYDAVKNGYSYFHVDSSLADDFTSNDIKFRKSFGALCLLGNQQKSIGLYVNEIDPRKSGQDRYTLIENGKITYRYGDQFNGNYLKQYPTIEMDGKNIGSYHIKTHSSCFVSPNLKKLLCRTSVGAMIEIFDIKGTSIQKTAEKEYIRPVYRFDNNQSKMIDNKTIYGFGPAYCSNEHIYLSYSGGAEWRPNKLIKMDWSGNEKELYYLPECTFEAFCVEDDKQVYAIIESLDGELQLINFSLN